MLNFSINVLVTRLLNYVSHFEEVTILVELNI